MEHNVYSLHVYSSTRYVKAKLLGEIFYAVVKYTMCEIYIALSQIVWEVAASIYRQAIRTDSEVNFIPKLNYYITSTK